MAGVFTSRKELGTGAGLAPRAGAKRRVYITAWFAGRNRAFGEGAHLEKSGWQ